MTNNPNLKFWDHYVPIEDLASRLNLKANTIRIWVREGKVPKHTYIKVGKTYRFNVNEVVKALTPKEDELEVDVPRNENDPVQLELDFSERTDDDI